MKKALVTGSSGRIGSSIVDVLKKDYDVVGLDLIPSKSTHVIGSILNENLMSDLLSKCDLVIHVAARHAPHVRKISEEEFSRVNVEGTKLIANLCLKFEIEKLVFTSTTALYGYSNQVEGKASWITEMTDPKPKTIYHRTKLEAEKYLESFTKENNLKVIVIRMSRCFPEPGNLMAIYRLHRGIDRRDVASAHKLALEFEQIEKFDKFIISGVTPFNESDCELLLTDPEEVVRKREPSLAKVFNSLKLNYPDVIDRVYDSTKAQDVLGWKQDFSYTEVIKQIKENSSEVLMPI